MLPCSAAPLSQPASTFAPGRAAEGFIPTELEGFCFFSKKYFCSSLLILICCYYLFITTRNTRELTEEIVFNYETEHSAPVIMETVRNAYVNILLRWEVLEALIYELKELHWSDLFDSVENF